MSPQEIAQKLWGWECENLIRLAAMRPPFLPSEPTTSGKAIELNLVQIRRYDNETLGTATLIWEVTPLGRAAPEALTEVKS